MGGCVPRIILSSFLVLSFLAGCGDDAPNGNPMGGAGGVGGIGGGSGTGGVGGELGCFEEVSLGGELGGPCREEGTTCNTGFDCVPELPDPIGGPGDPIAGLPPEVEEPVDRSFFQGTYCTLDLDFLCDPETCLAQCGLCSPIWGICMKACQPELANNSACRVGYECDMLDFVCTPGCTSDEECRISRQDGEGGAGGDSGMWVYNNDSDAVCNTETFRCEHSGTDGKEAGDACVFDEDCEPNGICLDGPDGYCSKFGCDIAGNECAGDAVCGFGRCLGACELGPTEMTPPIEDTQGCRPGYTCYWDRVDETIPSGFCDIGRFNSQDTNNIGETCDSSDQCYSPFGYGGCDPDFHCTVYECGVPGMPEGICGDGNSCVDFIDFGIDLFACLRDCTDAFDCVEGDACADLDEDPSTVDDLVCFPFCISDDECRDGLEVCNVNNRCVAP